MTQRTFLGTSAGTELQHARGRRVTPGNTKGQAGCGSGQPDVAEDAPTHCRSWIRWDLKVLSKPNRCLPLTPRTLVHQWLHPIFQSHRELNQPPTSLDTLQAVNKIKPQQGQSKQTVRDVGSWIFTLQMSLQTNREKSFLPSPASLILHAQVVTSSVSNIQAMQY